jgi:hypothetical protein
MQCTPSVRGGLLLRKTKKLNDVPPGVIPHGQRKRRDVYLCRFFVRVWVNVERVA